MWQRASYAKSRISTWRSNSKGGTAAHMARQIGVSRFMIYFERRSARGIEPNEPVRLHHLEDESNQLKRLVGDHDPQS